MLWSTHKHRSHTLPAWIISFAATIGMIDSFFLLLEFIQVLLHPGEPTPCTVSSFVSCTLTVQGPFGHYFPGIPNPMWGMLWYAGLVAYGVTRALGAEYPRKARMFVGALLLLGILFSYRLYLASVLQLGGVCPFCLISTTASTLIFLAFCIDDSRYVHPLLGVPGLRGFRLFQIFSVIVFVIGLPLFIGNGLRQMPSPMTAITHWSFPVMVVLVGIMACGHYWARKAISQ